MDDDDLLSVVARKDWVKAEELLASGVDVNQVDDQGRHALHYAAGYGEVEVVSLLLSSGATVDAVDRTGMTALHWACLKSKPGVVQALLQYTADPFIKATAGIFRGKTAADLCQSAEVRRLLLKQRGASFFELRKVVGRGAFGSVIKALRRDTGGVVALKAVHKEGLEHSDRSTKHMDAALTEKGLLAKLDHPFIVRLHCTFQTRRHLYLVMDFCSGGDLSAHIRWAGRLPEPTAQFIAAEVLLAVEYLHGEGIIHRDIKSENVLVDEEGHIRLADLNAAKQTVGDGRAYTQTGTLFAMAPEVLRGEGYSFPADWWSFGVLTFEMLAGIPPFPSHPSQKGQLVVQHAILHGEPAKLPKQVSNSARGFITQLLCKDPHQRSTASASMRTHAFFHGCDWELLVLKQMASPLLPRKQADKGEGLDIYRYPSNMMHMPTASPIAADSSQCQGESLGDEEHGKPRPALQVQDWDYVAEDRRPGEAAWRRVRQRVEQMAKRQGMTRAEFLIFYLLTLAANAATDIPQAPANALSAAAHADLVPSPIKKPEDQVATFDVNDDGI